MGETDRLTAEDLRAAIAALEEQPDPRERMTLARRALGLGKAVERDPDATLARIDLAMELLRQSYRRSMGTWNGNRTVTMLAKRRLEQLGPDTPRVISATRAKRVVLDAAAIAAAPGPVPDGWWKSGSANL